MSQTNQFNECLICQKPLNNQSPFLAQIIYDDIICFKCRSKLKPKLRKIKLNKYDLNYCYVYDDFFRHCLVLYKDFHDEALVDIFLYPILNEIRKKFKNYILIYVPSHLSQIEIRGFNHLPLIFQKLNLPLISAISKETVLQQKYLSSTLRKEVKFTLNESMISQLKNKKILLVDDVVTTGSSILKVTNLLKSEVKSIELFALAIHQSFLENG